MADGRKLKIKLNPNPEVNTDEIKEALRQNSGYCPCSIFKTDDTECMCKEFREMDTPGECHCGLYVKEYVSD